MRHVGELRNPNHEDIKHPSGGYAVIVKLHWTTPHWTLKEMICTSLQLPWNKWIDVRIGDDEAYRELFYPEKGAIICYYNFAAKDTVKPRAPLSQKLFRA